MMFIKFDNRSDNDEIISTEAAVDFDYDQLSETFKPQIELASFARKQLKK